jgi:hypothetical protein
MEILNPEIEFELPYKKNKEGNYVLMPNTKHIGGKNSLRKLQASKIEIGYLYLIRVINTNKYKIGVTTNIKRRFYDISSVMPFELEVLAVNQIKKPFDFEQKLLDTFSNKKIKNEWFELTVDDAKYIMITLHNQQVKDSM